ncbi:MAG: 50S ribosomal protein L21 [Mangrovibacterium sp.]
MKNKKKRAQTFATQINLFNFASSKCCIGSNKKTSIEVSPTRHHFIRLFIMYAIVEIAGQQFRVEADRKLYVHRLDAEVGAEVKFDKVLLVDNNGAITVGTPVVEGATVSAKVLDHLKGDKVIVFKKKRRKGYKKRNGHRQYLTQILIQTING